MNISDSDLHWGFPLCESVALFLKLGCYAFSVQTTWSLLRKNYNTTFNPGNRLIINWFNMKYQIEDWYLVSIYSWILVYGHCIKLARIRVFADLIMANTGQWIPVFSHILCSRYMLYFPILLDFYCFSCFSSQMLLYFWGEIWATKNPS